MHGGLKVFETKLTEIWIWPLSTLQPVVTPNLIVMDQPGEDFDLARCPHLPNDRIHSIVW